MNKIYFSLPLSLMCGIVGYIGKNQALSVLIDGLRRLEYRGYDSAGLAINYNNEVTSLKAVGKIKELQTKIGKKDIIGCSGIAHTRWATHGEPNEINAHPHHDCKSDIWLVHNGIIENYQDLKKQLIKKGHVFLSETDTEVLAHLIEDVYQGNLTKAVIKAMSLVKGAYGIVAFHKAESNKLVVAKNGSPLVIGIGNNETIIASDVSAIIRHTKQVIYLNDNEVAEVKKNNLRIFNFSSEEVKKEIQNIEWDIEQAEKQGFKHFMLKEIYEQPRSIIDSTRGRIIEKHGKVKLGGLEEVYDITRFMEKIIIVGCGTARHAGLIGQLIFEEYAGIPTAVEYASEFRYRKSILDQKTAVIAISQSGETADTLAAVREAKEKGALTLGIVNVVSSTIARETQAGVYNHIGPEIAVASTKAFTSQLAILILFAVMFGRQKAMSLVTGRRILQELNNIPNLIKLIIKQDKKIKYIAEKYQHAKSFAFLGRKYNYPTALEGALKLKELSYIHAEGFPSGEMKHGSIALIDENFPTLSICLKDSVYEKNLSNIEEIKSRGGKIIAIASEGDKNINSVADDVIYIPKTLEMLSPILATIPLQFLAYYTAVLRKFDVDKPRNLAKSVTVE